MGRIPVRDVRCNGCKNVFKSSQKNPQCGNCGGRNVVPVEDESTEKQKKQKDNIKLPELPIMTGLDLETQNNMQFLMNLGVGKSTETIIKKAIQNMRLNMEGKGGKMSEEKESPSDTLQKIQQSRLMEAEVDRIKRQNNGSGAADFGNDDADLNREFKIANLKKLQAQGVSPLEQMLAMEVFKDMRGKNNGGENSEVQMLRQELNEMKENKKYEDLRKGQEELRMLILESAKAKTGDTQTGLITQMSTIFANRDMEIAKLRSEVDSTKRDTNNQIINEKLARLEQALNGGKSDLSSFKDTFTTVKELAQQFNPNPAKKTGMESAQELISGVVNSIQKPILEPIGAAMAQAIANQGGGGQMPPQGMQGIQEIPQPQMITQQMSEEEISRGLVNVSVQ